MKNLFKNLMLVAVAAMAFTSCSQDVNELNKLEKKTTFEFVASFDGDTRSGFMEKEDGATAYKSEWFGGETVMLVAGDQVVPATVDAEGKFSATFEGEVSQIDIYTPMDSFYKPYMDLNFYQVNPEVLAVQTPLTNSVDPKAHVAKGYVMVDAEGNQIIPVSLAHEVAYGKMTVNAPAEFVIDHVVVNLVGSSNNFTYTLNADNVENNTFWFATEPIDVAEFTVTAYDAEGHAVAKTVDVAAAGKTLAFNYGRVSTFSVSGLETPAEKYDSTYAYVYQDYGANDKEIVFIADDNRALRIDFYNVYNDNCIVPGTYTFEGDGFMYPNWCYYYADVNGSYTSKLNGGQAVVSVEDGQYKIVFTNMAYESTVYVEQFTFKGLIDGIDFPDPRIKLAAPNVTAQITGKTIILDWESVTGADSYLIEIYSDVETVEPVSTTDTHFEYTVKSYDSYYSFEVTAVVAEDDAEYRNSGYAGYAEYTDPREQLPAPTNVSATVDGLSVTLLWDAVDYATGYEVQYYDNGSVVKNTTETSITLEMSDYDTEYYFYVFAVADENSDSYRTSPEAYTSATTGKDSNAPFAEYVLEYVTVNSNYFEFNRDWNNGSANTKTSLRIYMNGNDKGSNFINTGHYNCLGQGANTPSEAGCVNIRYCTDTWAYYYSTANNSATLDVSIVDGEYVIVATIDGKTWGYKGMPEDWVVPGSGSGDDNTGDGGDDNTGDGGDDNTDDDDDDDSQYGDGTQDNPYIYTCNVVRSGGYYRLTFTSQAAGAKPLYLESNNDIAGEFKEGAITAGNNWFPNACKYANGTITTTWDESTISFSHVEGTIYSFDEIKLSTFDGYVYYKCDSVNLY